MKNRDIACIQEISTRRVRRLYSEYRRMGAVPVLGKPGRPKSPPITDSERNAIRSVFEKYRLCSCYLERILLAQGIKINHRRYTKC
jgi:transposase